MYWLISQHMGKYYSITASSFSQPKHHSVLATHEHVLMEQDYSYNTHHEPKPSNNLSWAIATNSGMTSPFILILQDCAQPSSFSQGQSTGALELLWNKLRSKGCTCICDFDPLKAELSLRWEGVILSKGTVL